MGGLPTLTDVSLHDTDEEGIIFILDNEGIINTGQKD